MIFNPKFASFRLRIALLALVLWIDAYVVFKGHAISAKAMVILALAVTFAAIIPESPAKKPAEKYHFIE